MYNIHLIQTLLQIDLFMLDVPEKQEERIHKHTSSFLGFQQNGGYCHLLSLGMYNYALFVFLRLWFLSINLFILAIFCFWSFWIASFRPFYGILCHFNIICPLYTESIEVCMNSNGYQSRKAEKVLKDSQKEKKLRMFWITIAVQQNSVASLFSVHWDRCTSPSFGLHLALEEKSNPEYFLLCHFQCCS